MACIKTGCQIFLADYGAYAYGDAYEVGGAFVLKLAGDLSRRPVGVRVNYTVLSNPEQLLVGGSSVWDLGRNAAIIVPMTQTTETENA